MNQGLSLSVLALMLAAGVATIGAQTWTLYNTGGQVPSVLTDVGEATEEPVFEVAPASFAPETVDVDAILDKALFDIARSRPQPAPEPEPEPEPEPVVVEVDHSLNIDILGIVLQDGAGYLVTKSAENSQPRQITVGDTVDGWTLVQLTATVAVFEREGEETRLSLSLR